MGEAEFATAAALTRLEHTAMLGVTPVSVELLAEGRLAKVEVKFSGYAKLLSYLEELNTGEEAVRWQLLCATSKAIGLQTWTALLGSRW